MCCAAPVDTVGCCSLCSNTPVHCLLRCVWCGRMRVHSAQQRVPTAAATSELQQQAAMARRCCKHKAAAAAAEQQLSHCPHSEQPGRVSPSPHPTHVSQHSPQRPFRAAYAAAAHSSCRRSGGRTVRHSNSGGAHTISKSTGHPVTARTVAAVTLCNHCTNSSIATDSIQFIDAATADCYKLTV